MTQRQIIRPFGKGEGPSLEFKEAGDTLPRSFFETVCAFLNLDGDGERGLEPAWRDAK